MKNFFRKDLELSKKRWHRLVSVARFLSIVIILIFCGLYVYDGYYYGDYMDYREYVGPLLDRTDNEVRDLHDLLKPGEYVDFAPNSYKSRYNTELLDIPSGMSRCSKGWDASKISKLNGKLGKKIVGGNTTNNYKVYGEIADSVVGECIFRVDGVFHYDGGSLYIYTINHPNKLKVTMGWLIPRVGKSILVVLVYIGLSLLVYYKGVLYVVYGETRQSKKKKKSE